MAQKYQTNDLRDSLPVHPTKKPTERGLGSLNMIVVHTTDWDTDVVTLAKYDIGPNHISSTGCPTATYHDVIMKDGTRQHCVPYKFVTWHAGKWNTKSVAVALMYRCSQPGKPDLSPTADQMESLKQLLVSQCLVLKISPMNIKGHRELEFTGFVWKYTKDGKASKSLIKTCPGMQVDLDRLRLDIATRVQMRMKIDGYYKGAIDGIFGPKSEAALRDWRPKT